MEFERFWWKWPNKHGFCLPRSFFWNYWNWSCRVWSLFCHFIDGYIRHVFSILIGWSANWALIWKLKKAQLWHFERETSLRLFAGHQETVNCVKFHPNSNYLFTGSDDRSIRLWDINSGRDLRFYFPPDLPTGPMIGSWIPEIRKMRKSIFHE